MSAALAVSAELAASVQRMLGRTWNDERASAFEAGAARTRPAHRNGPGPEPFSRRKLTDPAKEARRARKRVLGGSSNLPPDFRRHFTEGERSALAVISGEVKTKGTCELSLKEIGDRAGVCRTMVQRAIGKAIAKDLIKRTPRKKGPRLNDTSIVSIVSDEWLAWIKRAPAAAKGYATFVPTLETVDSAAAEPRAHARAEKGCPTKEAIELAGDIASIAGYSAKLPESWKAANPPIVVQGWLDQLGKDVSVFDPFRSAADFVRQQARWVMRRKPDPAPPRSPRYFSPAIAERVADIAALRAQRRAA